MPPFAGYSLSGADGRVFALGSATFHGSMGGTLLNQPVVGIIATTDGKGYWEVATDGSVASLSDADQVGSLPGIGITVDDVVGITGVAGAAGPILPGVAPSSGPSAGGTSVTLTGIGFTGATSVTFGDLEAPSLVVVSDTEATVVTPSSPPGAVDVPVTTPYRTETLPNGFTFSRCAPRHY